MNPYKKILRKFFSEYVRTLRKCRGLTQEEMAEKLRISGRAYSDLERGIYCFSTVALVFLLLMLEEGEIKELLSPLLDERAEWWRSDPFFHDKPTEEESLLFVGHVGVLLTAEDGTLHFVEKVAFQEPYRMLRFADRTALSDYLMGKYDTSWGQDMASPFIMENDKLMDGWRPNPDSGSSAIG